MSRLVDPLPAFAAPPNNSSSGIPTGGGVGSYGYDGVLGDRCSADGDESCGEEGDDGETHSCLNTVFFKVEKSSYTGEREESWAEEARLGLGEEK